MRKNASDCADTDCATRFAQPAHPARTDCATGALALYQLEPAAIDEVAALVALRVPLETDQRAPFDGLDDTVRRPRAGGEAGRELCNRLPVRGADALGRVPSS